MFYLFTGNEYYPQGGFNDFKGRFNTLDEALSYKNKLLPNGDDDYSWWHIVEDIENVEWKIVVENER